MPSTAIRDFHYDAAAAQLTVTFITRRRYNYFAVPRGVYEAFKAAPSKGGFFNTEIRDRYYYEEVH